MDLVQEPVRRLGHMSTKICSTCRIFLPYKDYYPREWQKREKRTCTECRKNEHGALGGQSAAGAGAGASATACDVGASADACFQRRCLGLAAPMHATVVLRVSAFNVAAFNQNMCMRSGVSNLPTNAFGC